MDWTGAMVETVPREFQRGGAVACAKGSGNGMDQQWSRQWDQQLHTRVNQQWMNKGHHLLLLVCNRTIVCTEEACELFSWLDCCHCLVTLLFCACANCKNNGMGTCQDQAVPSCLCRLCRLALQMGRDFCRGQAVNVWNAWVLCRRWFRLSQPV